MNSNLKNIIIGIIIGVLATMTIGYLVNDVRIDIKVESSESIDNEIDS